MPSQIILGITGTIGAGIGTVVNLLTGQDYGFRHYSVHGYLEQAIRKRGLENNRDVMRKLANELLSAYGASYIVAQLYDEASSSGGNAIIETIRTTGEARFLKRFRNFMLLAVDADPRLRYDRIVAAGNILPYEEFMEQERLESASHDPDQQNLPGVIGLSDWIVMNDGTLTDLRAEIRRTIQGFLKKAEARG